MILAVVVLGIFTISAAATEEKTAIGIVQSNGLRLRAKANTDAEILSSAAYGDSVVVIRKVDDWYLVDYNLEIGYMSADHLLIKEKENIDLGPGLVNTSSVNLRATPDSSGELLAQLAYGYTADIIGFNCGWYKVTFGDWTGYVRSDLLDLTQAPAANSSGVTSLSSQIVDFSSTLLGTPYVWGGTSTSGFDCSGFTKYVYSQFGISLNRTANQQLGNGYSVSSLSVGDLVFFGNTYSSSATATHVGIYIGDNQFIHAAGSSVKITSMSDSYYACRYVGATRVL